MPPRIFAVGEPIDGGTEPQAFIGEERSLITKRAQAANRGMNAGELALYDAFLAEADSLVATINRERAADDADRAARDTVPAAIRDNGAPSSEDAALVLSREHRDSGRCQHGVNRQLSAQPVDDGRKLRRRLRPRPVHELESAQAVSAPQGTDRHQEAHIAAGCFCQR